MLDPWKQVGRALAKLPKLETLQLLFASIDCAISLFEDRNFRRNGCPLKEFCYNDCYQLRSRYMEDLQPYQKFSTMLTACQKCINLETLRIGKFLDGDLEYPIVGRKLGYEVVKPVSIPLWPFEACGVQRPFAEAPLLTRACSTLTTIGVQFCSRAALWRLLTCVNENNALEVLIVRSDDRRLQSGYLEGAKPCHLFLDFVMFLFSLIISFIMSQAITTSVSLYFMLIVVKLNDQIAHCNMWQSMFWRSTPSSPVFTRA